MPVKSVIEIDVDDSAFQNFQRVYQQWHSLVQGAPAAWQKVNTQIKEGREAFEGLVAKYAVANLQAKQIESAQRAADQITRTTAERWRDMARSAGSVASAVRSTTVDLLKWGTITSVAGGLLGVGSLFGLDRLAATVSSARKTSLGLGIGYGEQKAFGTNFERFVADPQGFLSSVAGAKLDITKRVGLIGAGLSEQEMAGDAAHTAVALLRHLKQIADTTNPQLYAQVIGARRLDQFVSPEDLQRLHNTRGELEQVIGSYDRNRTAFDVPPDVTQAWQEFTTQMSRAGQGIENTFVRGLAPLADPLTHLSEGFEKVVHAFLVAPTLERWITEAGGGLEKLAKYVGTDDFQHKVENFVKNVGDLAEAAGTAARWILSWFSKPDHGADIHLRAAIGHRRRLARGEVPNPVEDYLSSTLGFDWLSERMSRRSFSKSRRDLAFSGPPGPPMSFDAVVEINSKNRDLAFSGPPGPPMSFDAVVEIIRKLEGSGHQEVSKAGAIGRYQIMPATARRHGVDPSALYDPRVNEAVARAEIADLIRQYHGNTAEVLAGYNASALATRQFVLSGGTDVGTLPAETQKYVTKGSQMPGFAPTVVTIDDNTGGNVNVSVNGLKN